MVDWALHNLGDQVHPTNVE